MTTTCFEVVPEGKGWIVRSQAEVLYRFHTQMEAFNAAVAEARRVKQTGSGAQVRILRPERRVIWLEA